MLNLDISTSNEWHLLKGEDQFGPFDYPEMIRMKQKNLVFDFDYVWSPHLEAWTQVIELPEFSTDRISRLIEKSPESAVFERRSSPRIQVDLETFVHNNEEMWTAVTETLSLGGALIRIPNPLLLPPEKLTVHIKTEFGPLVVLGEIINKRMIKGRIEHDTQIGYVIKFSPIQGEDRSNVLKNIINKHISLQLKVSSDQKGE